MEEVIPAFLGPIVNQIPRMEDLRRMMNEAAQGNVQQIINQVHKQFQGENRLMVQAEVERQMQGEAPGGQGPRVLANPPWGPQLAPPY